MALEVSSLAPDILTRAFSHGLHEGDFVWSLAKKPPHDYDELLARAERYVNVEEAQKLGRTIRALTLPKKEVEGIAVKSTSFQRHLLLLCIMLHLCPGA